MQVTVYESTTINRYFKTTRRAVVTSDESMAQAMLFNMQDPRDASRRHTDLVTQQGENIVNWIGTQEVLSRGMN